jgi:small-conductance mechanosensitive channel
MDLTGSQLLAGLMEALRDLRNPLVLKELAVIALALVAGALAAWLVNRRSASAPPSWEVGKGGLLRIVFPVVALLVVMIGRRMMLHQGAHPMLDVAVPLLGSLALVRLALYIVRRVFPPNAFLKASERFIGYGIWSLMALYIVGVLPFVTEVLDGISVTVGKQRISVFLILQAIVTVVITVVIALWIARAIESRAMGAAHWDPSLRAVFIKLVRVILLALAVLIALPAVGIDITVLSVFGGALGVGLGFGLQKIASNYVSGFIILLDRSIRLGDLVTIDQRQGVVSQLNTRYTVVRSLDGTEAIIPNESLITGTVINHSLSDKRVLLRLPLQISYGSPLPLALELLTGIAREQPRALKEPQAGAFVTGFGENGIDLEICLWIADPEAGQIHLRSELFLGIWQAFKDNGIQIPYPQREIRILRDAETKPETGPNQAES